MFKRYTGIVSLLLVVLVGSTLISGCGAQRTATQVTQLVVTESPTQLVASPTPEPTPTLPPPPAAAMVNGVPILLSYFEHEVMRYKAALDPSLPVASDSEISQLVLASLIDQSLLAQAAHANGYILDEAGVDTRIDQLAAQLGSVDALTQWMQTNFYDEVEFRDAIKLAGEAAWQRDQILSGVSEKVEQAHVRQIITQTRGNADAALLELGAGTDFDLIALRYSPSTGGELGWFPRGYLNHPEIEEAAFSLPVGSYSQVISTEIGFHIIKVIERDSEHLLTTDALLSLQTNAFNEWLTQTRSVALIEVTLP